MAPKVHASSLASANINPAMQSIVHVLGLTSYELLNYLVDEVEKNPLLDFDHFDSFYYERNNQIIEKNYDLQENLIASTDLKNFLINQLYEYKIEEEDYFLGKYIILNLDEYGYLNSSCDSIKKLYQMNIRSEKIQEIIKIIKKLEPHGTASDDFNSFLSYQLKKISETEIVKIALKINEINPEIWYKPSLYEKIKNELLISRDDFMQALSLVRSQKPFPFYGYSTDQTNNSIAADIKIVKKNNEWDINLINDFSEYIKIDESYTHLIEKSNIIKNWNNNAKSLIKNLSIRKENLIKISFFILKNQIKFFENGINDLEPMSVNYAAKSLNLSESTIYRIINEKYLSCNHGTFEMKWFFTQQKNQTETKTTFHHIDKKIQQIIKNEDVDNPLSDNDIKKQLESYNIFISRRTVTKYRLRLNILSSSERKYI